MRVLRHEEHPTACEYTCNGNYTTAWSRTVLGYEAQPLAYLLELVYNYGIANYTQGENLRVIALRPPMPVPMAVAAAESLGFGPVMQDGGFELLRDMGYTDEERFLYSLDSESDKATLITGPEGYRFMLLPSSGGAAVEPFDHIRLRVRDLRASFDYYTRLLGMGDYTLVAEQQGLFPYRCREVMAVVGYGPPGGADRSVVPLYMEELTDGKPIPVTDWDGRMYLTLPAASLRIVYSWVHHYAPWSVVHRLVYSAKDDLGTLLTFVLRDPDGLEITVNSAEVYDDSVLAENNASSFDIAGYFNESFNESDPGSALASGLYPWQGSIEPDWAYRAELEAQAAPQDELPLDPLCERYRCPLSFPEPRPPLPPWHHWPEHPRGRE